MRKCRANQYIPNVLYESQIINIRAVELLPDQIIRVKRPLLREDIATQPLIVRVRDLLGLAEVLLDLIEVVLLTLLILGRLQEVVCFARGLILFLEEFFSLINFLLLKFLQ